jgi:hypothetical protein
MPLAAGELQGIHPRGGGPTHSESTKDAGAPPFSALFAERVGGETLNRVPILDEVISESRKLKSGCGS